MNHQVLLPLAVSSVEIASLRPCQKIVVTDGFELNPNLKRNLLNLDWTICTLSSQAGASAAKNTGIEVINSDIKYVTFLDADDLVHPAYFENAIIEMQRRDLQAVGCQAVIFQNSNNKIRNVCFKGHPKRPLLTTKSQRPWNFKRVFAIYASVIVDVKVFGIIGNFKSSLNRGEDHDFYSRLVTNGFSLENLDSKYYAYRHQNFDTFAKFVSDNKVRGTKHFLKLRYVRNCIYRAINLPLQKSIKKDWLKVYSEAVDYSEANNLQLDFGLKNE